MATPDCATAHRARIGARARLQPGSSIRSSLGGASISGPLNASPTNSPTSGSRSTVVPSPATSAGFVWASEVSSIPAATITASPGRSPPAARAHGVPGREEGRPDSRWWRLPCPWPRQRPGQNRQSSEVSWREWPGCSAAGSQCPLCQGELRPQVSEKSACGAMRSADPCVGDGGHNG